MVQTVISDEELFCLFEKAFGHRNLDKKVDFIKDILRRYKAMGEPVCVSLFGMPLLLCFVLCTVSIDLVLLS